MTSNPTDRELRWVGLLIGVLLAALALLAVGSWAFASLGFAVESLFSDEALRWLFSSETINVVAPVSQWVLLIAVVVGSVMHCGLTAQAPRFNNALVTAVLTFVICLAVLFLFFFASGSPLRSATGRLFPTPFLLGFIRALAVAVILAAAVYGGISGRLRTWQHYVALLYIGIQRFAPWLAVAVLAALLYHIFCYVI